jgi:hypothetical protein
MACGAGTVGASQQRNILETTVGMLRHFGIPLNAEDADAFAAGFLSETETEFNAKLEQLKHLVLVPRFLPPKVQRLNGPRAPRFFCLMFQKAGRPKGQTNLFPRSQHNLACPVLVQPEMERGRSPLVSIPPLGRGFFKATNKTTRLSLGVVASPQSRFRFARQNHCSSAACIRLKFRMRRHLSTTPEAEPE